jgi:serine/threonine protein kinase
MEYMDGGNLGDRLDDNPKGLPIDEALWIGECICNGLEVAHNYGVAHLDLKPANILFKKTADSVWDVPKIGDWGLARVLAEETGTLDGLSVKYAAPEHFESDEFGDPDTLTDIYQVGAIVYSLLAGQPPYTGSQTSIIYDIVHGNEVPRPSSVRNKLTNTVDMVVQKALSRNKKDRYRNITQFEEALRSIRTDQQPSLNVNQTEYLQEGNSNHSLVDDIKKDSKTTEAGSKGSDAKSINTSAKAEGEYIEMELIGFDKKYIDFEDRDNDLFEQKKYTVIALHVKNNTSNVWEFHGHMDLSVTSTEGFSHSTLQENGWSSRSGQFAPWNNATRPEIKPESKSRIVIILKSWFDLSKIEYTPRPSFSHQGDVDYEGRERLSIELNKELREELNSLPESLPIEDVVLN